MTDIVERVEAQRDVCPRGLPWWLVDELVERVQRLLTQCDLLRAHCRETIAGREKAWAEVKRWQEIAISAYDGNELMQGEAQVELLSAEAELERLRQTYDMASESWDQSTALMLDEIERLRPRQIETVEELKALPFGSVVRPIEGGIYEYKERVYGSSWFNNGRPYGPTQVPLPALLLWTPEVN